MSMESVNTRTAGTSVLGAGRDGCAAPSRKDTAAGLAQVERAMLTAREKRNGGPMDSVALEGEYARLVEELNGDVTGRERAQAYLAGTRSLYHGAPMPWAAVPKIFSPDDARHLAWAAETMGAIMDKLTRRYVEDPELRAKFGFTPEVEAATLVPLPYEQQIPIARVDIFLDERTGAFKFCELNTDGSAGMLNTVETTRACALTDAGKRFATAHQVAVFDVLGACADALMDCYRQVPGAVEKPEIAVVDYAESISADEVAEFIELFAERGIRMRFTDIHDLTYEGGVLRDGQGVIDCVWRRVVISELLEKPCPGAEAFTRAAQEGRVPIIGGFRTWPTATKTVFSVLHDPIAATFLTADELAFVKEHVPATYMLEEGGDLAPFADRCAWIAKPRDGYNSMGVVAGVDCTDAEWRQVLEQTRAGGGVVQEYVRPYATANLPGDPDAGTGLAPYMNMEGLYLFNGRFAGVFTRCGRNATIGEFTGRLMMSCLVAEG